MEYRDYRDDIEGLSEETVRLVRHFELLWRREIPPPSPETWSMHQRTRRLAHPLITPDIPERLMAEMLKARMEYGSENAFQVWCDQVRRMGGPVLNPRYVESYVRAVAAGYSRVVNPSIREALLLFDHGIQPGSLPRMPAKRLPGKPTYYAVRKAAGKAGKAPRRRAGTDEVRQPAT
ncbi:MAG: hypothetical protein ACAH20_06205 [Methylobacteriaceae bacterium]